MTIVKERVQEDVSEKLHFREPRVEDGDQVWTLVKEAQILDLNSSYSYLMLCKFFRDTCVVAECNNKVVGFVSAFRPPTDDQSIFVWQVVVDRSQRGKGLASRLLKEVLRREACKEVRYVTATISPSNEPSQGLFKRLAKDMNTECQVSEFFSEEMFPGEGHEKELLFRIGPFNLKQNEEVQKVLYEYS